MKGRWQRLLCWNKCAVRGGKSDLQIQVLDATCCAWRRIWEPWRSECKSTLDSNLVQLQTVWSPAPSYPFAPSSCHSSRLASCSFNTQVYPNLEPFAIAVSSAWNALSSGLCIVHSVTLFRFLLKCHHLGRDPPITFSKLVPSVISLFLRGAWLN